MFYVQENNANGIEGSVDYFENETAAKVFLAWLAYTGSKIEDRFKGFSSLKEAYEFVNFKYTGDSSSMTVSIREPWAFTNWRENYPNKTAVDYENDLDFCELEEPLFEIGRVVSSKLPDFLFAEAIVAGVDFTES